MTAAVFLARHDVAAHVVVKYELLDLWCKHLVALVLALDVEVDVAVVVDRTLADGLAIEVVHGSVQRQLCALAKVDVRYVLEMTDEGEALRAHHLLVSGRELQPWVAQDVLDVRTLVRVLLEDLEQQLPSRSRNVVRNRQVLLADVAVELLVVLSFEWKSAAEQSVEQDTKCPDISRWTCVLDLADDLWRHVGGRTAEDFDFLLVRNAG